MSKYLVSLNKNKNRNTHFGVFDIETVSLPNGFLLPYAIGFYFKNHINAQEYYRSYFLGAELHTGLFELMSDSKIHIWKKKSREMIYTAWQNLLNFSFISNITFYAHNFGSFDAFFILEVLCQLGKVTVIRRNGVFYAFSFRAFNTSIKIQIKDSYLILPESLLELSRIYDPQYHKMSFDHSMINLNNFFLYTKSIFYYLERDCILLYKIIDRTSDFIFSNYQLNITDTVTLSSLSFKIYRTHFLKNHLIAVDQRWTSIYVRNSFFGGIVDVYLPRGRSLYWYDVNSLYPFIMANYNLPAFNPKRCTRSLSKDDLASFCGFVFVQIKHTPELKIPLLPYRTKQNRLCTPTGQWSGYYYGPELYKAYTLGYEFDIFSAIEYQPSLLFTDFVSHFYTKKVNSIGFERLLYKLILNTLSGRWALKNHITNTKILSLSELNKYQSSCSICNIYPMDNSLFYVDYNLERESSKFLSIDSYSPLNSPQITAAITALARMYMYDFKTIPGNPCFYSDTDSIFLQFPLDSKWTSDKELGLFKLENKSACIMDAIFLNPKTYSLLLQSSDGSIQNVIKSKTIPAQFLSHQDFIYAYEKSFKKEVQSVQIQQSMLYLYESKRTQVFQMHMPNLKRIPLFNESGLWVDTQPIQIKE